MKLFTNSTFAWWHISLFKISTVCFGIVVGSYWHDFFATYLTPLLVISLLSGAYISWVYFKQH